MKVRSFNYSCAAFLAPVGLCKGDRRATKWCTLSSGGPTLTTIDGARKVVAKRAVIRCSEKEESSAAFETSEPCSSDDQSLSRISRRAALHTASGALGLILFQSAFDINPAKAVAQRTIVNGVLAGYGLPQLPDVAGFSPKLAQFDNIVVEFTYPSSWVPSNAGSKSAAARSAEGRASPLTVADYRRAEGAAVYLGPTSEKWTSIEDVKPDQIARLVLPGDATRTDPEFRLVGRAALEDDPAYNVLEFEHDTVTVSGYNVERRSVVCATVIKGQLLALSASCSASRYRAVGRDLKRIAQSFRAARL
mmetsp:Transcript_5147/g.10892  ORF Transcript_5147/g.10892 Transcript_5147/m.10892 type:complete len:306 (+) Transcript_5147:25-942(+)